MELRNAPSMETGMLIRRPVAEVFEAFVDPAVTSRFWFSKGSGRLQPGARVRWDWEMYGVYAQVEVKAIQANERILIEWGAEGEAPTIVEWRFLARAEDQTFVTIANTGFSGDGDEVVRKAMDSMQGFSLLLAGAKAFLEHGVELNLVPDRYPDAIVKGWSGKSRTA